MATFDWQKGSNNSPVTATSRITSIGRNDMAEEKELPTVTLIFDGEEKECTVTVDRNGEYVCEAEDGSFLKFPKDSDLDEEVEAYNEKNQ